jgi:hypothetical protein
MVVLKIRHTTFLISIFYLLSCTSKPEFNEKDKIFHGGPASGGIGGIYFALYKGYKYQLCESGGIGETCYSGDFTLSGDTIVLQNLSNDCYLKNNRLLICKYNEKDSTYWQWKYPRHIMDWRSMKEQDILMGNEGDVHQLNAQNELILDPTYYFVIKMDSLKNYR